MTPHEAAALVGAACPAEDFLLCLIGARGGQVSIDAHEGNVEAVTVWGAAAYAQLDALKAECEVGSPEALGFDLIGARVEDQLRTARLRRFVLNIPRPAGKENP